ncbi:MAG: phosphate ABC transporter, permease protein PstA [SAR116 cluster bacterium MED-G04]|nr:MAG: phosphate ABC transporter, permease protein PstA [SAR116 cluster bacterium MED-G04]HCD48747.1 phosphate ABC transporter permease PtsA [Alphaproteobacteria bacterium]HCV62996.1 phosphate ABC transporter permease PtsA [Alphaproteobacteria bacterium]
MEFIRRSLNRRHASEKRLRFYGVAAICFALGFLVVLLTTVVTNGYTALQQTEVAVELAIPVEELLDENGDIDMKKSADFNWNGLVKKAFRGYFPEVKGMMDKRMLGDLISANAGFELREELEKIGRIDTPDRLYWIKASDDVDMLMKGRMDRTIPENQRRLNDRQIAWVDDLVANENLRLVFNRAFFTKADSREPESAGILGAVVGSALALIVTVVLALPLAVMAAIYLEYFAKPGRLTDFIEVNVNNLAAVPSIVFGLLGLAVFLGFFGMPRSAPLVGGMVLALMTLPTIIIATRASIRAVPPSIRDAALGVGASPMQAAIDHVLPLAAPGILTGTIIGLAQALGETAPLIMIGMVAFIVDVPTSVTSPATALPVQIFIWSDSAERAFYERSSLAIVCLLMFLIIMNLAAVILRRKLQKKW